MMDFGYLNKLLMNRPFPQPAAQVDNQQGHSKLDDYLSRMPENVRRKYMTLLGGVSPNQGELQ